ncbi:hypothetical protein ACQ4WY_03820 [Janthinobacterium sp. LB2P49]|uniref:hypothetical protein n=1 Tax=Janthinobacterium sp. LB2P49 TaxID=3424198 RepID=UPI003F1EEF8C
MRQLLSLTLLRAAAGCAAGNHGDKKTPDIIGMSSFGLAARYGTPASYQHLGVLLEQAIFTDQVLGFLVVGQ